MHRACKYDSHHRKAFRTYLLAHLSDQITSSGHARLHFKGATSRDLRLAERFARRYGLSAEIAQQPNGDGTFEAYIHIRSFDRMSVHLTNVTANELKLVERLTRKYKHSIEMTAEQESDGTYNLCLQIRRGGSSHFRGENPTPRELELIARIAHLHQFSIEVISGDGVHKTIHVNPLDHGKMYEHSYLRVYGELERIIASRNASNIHQPIEIQLPFRSRKTAHRLVEKLRQRGHNVHPVREAFSQYKLRFPEGIRSILH